jgi:hypothetical protein
MTSIFFLNSTPSGLLIMGGCLWYGGLTPSGSEILVTSEKYSMNSAGIYPNCGSVFNFNHQQLSFCGANKSLV